MNKLVDIDDIIVIHSNFLMLLNNIETIEADSYFETLENSIQVFVKKYKFDKKVIQEILLLLSESRLKLKVFIYLIQNKYDFSVMY